MPDFDINAYFNSKLPPAEGSALSKLDALEQASKAKFDALENTHIKAVAAVEASTAQQKLIDASWSGQLGIPSSSFIGNRVNDAASLVSGASRLVGQVTSLAPSAASMVDTLGATPEEYDAYNRAKIAKPLPGDDAILNRTTGTDGRSVKEVFDNAERLRSSARKVNDFFNLESIVDPTNRTKLDTSLRKGFDEPWAQASTGASAISNGDIKSGSINLAEGVAKLLYNTGASLINNGSAVREYIIENAPQLLVGAVGKVGSAAMLASNVGYAADYYQQGLENYAKENGGQLPPENVRQKMSMQAASLAAAEHLGDKIGLGAMNLGKKASDEAIKNSFKQSLKNVRNAAIEGAVSEAPTEAYQTYTEGQITGKPASAYDIYSAGVIGAASGAGLAGGGRTLAESTGNTESKIAERQQEVKASVKLDDAIASGNVSEYLDVKSPTYAPEKAVVALYGNSKLADKTPEDKQALLKQATDIVSNLHGEKEKATESRYLVSPEGIAEKKATLAQIKQEEANLDPESVNKKAAYAEAITALEGEIASAEQSSKDAIPRLDSQIKKIDSQLKESQDTLSVFNKEILAPQEINVSEEAKVINTPAADTQQAEVQQASTDRVINLSMAVPERLDSRLATELADNTGNSLTEPQRSYLRAFSLARQIENSLKSDSDVSNDIYFGNKKLRQVGIADYRSNVMNALAGGNQAFADTQIAGLAKFEADHVAKAAMANQAMEQGKGTAIVRTKDGKWEITDQPITQQQRQENGSWISNSVEKNQQLVLEAQALTAALNELKAAYALKFTTPQVTQGVINVPDISQREVEQTLQPSTEEGQVPASIGVVESQDIGTTAGDVELQSSASPVANTVTQEATASTVNPVVDPVIEEQLQSNTDVNTAGLEVTNPAVVLTPLAQKSPEGTPHNQKRFGDFFTQNAGEDTEGSIRPLASVKDFWSQIKSGAVNVRSYLKNKGELTGTQQAALNLFNRKVTEWSEAIRKDLRIPHNTKFDYEKPMNYLVSVLENDGVKSADVDENVKTAITAAVFSFIVDQAGRTGINNQKAINAILGRGSDTPVSDAAYELLAEIGQYQPVVADSIGGKIMDSLGIVAGKDTPKDIPAKLRAALGAHALKLMEDQDLLVREGVQGDVIEALRNEGKDPEKQTTTENAANTPHYFYRVGPKASEISKALKGSQNIIGNLFGIESEIVTPSLVPNKELQRRSDSGMKLPNLIRKVFRQKQTKDAWYVSKDPMALLRQFSEEELFSLAGVVEVTDQNTHVRNVLSRQAKNDGLIRQVRQFMEFVEEEILPSELGLDQPMFLTPRMWKQQRAGLVNNVANPQTSKVVRPLMAPREWDTEIKLDALDLVQSFKLRVAEGLGRKTEETPSEKSEAWIDAKMQEPVFKQAVEAMQASLVGIELSPEQKRAIITANQQGGENLHTLVSLLAWAKYQNAIANGDTSFVTNLMGEVDGKANGSSLNMVLYGAASTPTGLLNKVEQGGMFNAGSSAQQYNQWYGGNNRDIYQANAVLAYGAISNLSKSGKLTGLLINAIWATSKVPVDPDGTVTKGGRNLMKTALNPLNYGSGFQSITRNMSASYIDGIYAQFEEFSKADAPQEEINSFVNSLNSILKETGDRQLPIGLPIRKYMATKLTDSQVIGLKSVYEQLIAYPVTNVIKESFGSLLTKTKRLVATTKLTFDIYNAVYTAEREALIKELGIPVTKKGPVHDLTPAQEKTLAEKLKDIYPMMDTAMSAADGDITHGILLASHERGINNTAAYTQSVTFGTPLKNGNSQLTIRGYSVKDTNPGVTPISASTQALDSRISHIVQNGRNILNAHDAIGAGIGMLQDSANALNKATWNSLLNYSPLTASYEALMRVMQGLAKMEKEGNLSKEVKQALKRLNPSKVDFATELIRVFNLAKQADTVKLGAMSQWTSIDQYAFANGNYEVTDYDREEAKKKLAELPASIPELDMDSVFAVLDAINGKKVEKTVATTSNGNPSVFGELGTSAINSDSDLVDFFNRTPTTNASAVIKLLAAPGRLNDINRKILQLINRTVNPNLEIKYITPDTPQSEVIELPTKPSRGWFVSKEGKEAIYVLSKDFQNSGLTAETLLHELVHASVARVIDDPSTEAKQLVNELEALRKQASQYVKDSGLTQYDSALEDVQELVAWGMSNVDFQRDVLNKITVPTKTKSNILVSGMQKFIDTLSRLLFKNPDEGLTTGLGLLVTNVAGLFNAAANSNPQVTPVDSPKGISLVTTLLNAQDKVDALDAWEGKTVEHKKLLSAIQEAADALTNETSRIIGRMQSFGTETAKELKERLQDLPNALIDTTNDELIDLYKDALAYAKEYNTNQGSLNFSMEKNPIEKFSTMEVFTALDNGSISPSFSDHLQNLLTGIVEKLHGPFGAIHEAMRKTEAGNPMAVWLKALETGKAPFASSIVASGFAASSQEDFVMQQVEATVKVVLDTDTTFTKVAYKALSDLYTEAYKKLEPSDFNSQADYDFVFKLESTNGNRSDYLARFAALGLGHQGFNKLLQFASKTDTRKLTDKQTFTARLQLLFEKILSFFNDRVTKTYAGQHLDSKLEALVGQLVDIEAKKRHAIKLDLQAKDYLAPIENIVKQGYDSAREGIVKLASLPIVKNSANGFVAGAGGLVRIVAGNQVERVLGFLKEQSNNPQNLITNLAQEVVGHSLTLQSLLRGTQENARQRKNIITNIAKFSTQAFVNEGKGLTKEGKAAISAVFLRTGLHNLLGAFDLNQIQDLLGNEKQLSDSINAYEAQLTSAIKDKHIEAANVLGKYKATGQVRGVLMLNAHVIARMFGFQKYASQITEQEASKAEATIKVLATLYALKYTDRRVLLQAQEILNAENQRSDGNGIEYTLALHKEMERDALFKVFDNNPVQMIHGYTPEILNPYTEVKMASIAEGRDLLAQGYAQGALIQNDKSDPDSVSKRIYVLRDGGLARWLSGAISLTGLGTKGAQKNNGYLNPNTALGNQNLSMNTQIVNDKLNLLGSNLDPKRDLSSVKDNYMAPVYDDLGNIVNWRYLMQEDVKNSVLERNNDFDQILGTLAGSTYDKVSSKDQNKKVIDALFEQFNKDYTTKRKMYVLVGPNSEDTNARNLWNMLPDQTKRDAREVWGGDGMWVKGESLDMVFGYRKLSTANFLRAEQETLEGFQKILREWFNIYAKSRGMETKEADNYAKRLGIMLTRGEHVWQEIVREAKDLMVIKTGMVMLGNIWSNESLLTLNGVPLLGRTGHHLAALKGATAYQVDTTELLRLQTLLDTGYTQGNATEIKRQIVRLKDAIDRNPVRKLVEAGLMPTIVEDIGSSEDSYSYKSMFARKTEKYTNRLNPTIKNVGKQIYMAHDTKLYQGLSRITQLSDFVARYTLYQHLTTRKNNPLSHEDAIQKASEAFVNYDIPMHRGLQYTDDMGITMFTKYFLRIQKPLIEVAKENPARVLATVALGHFMNLGPIVLDSSFMHHIGNNPLRFGAFEYPGVLDQLGTVSVMGDALKLMH